ncbi:hypothetical protein JCM11641_001293 [Rhodosporidiobolus odoratus]
MAMGEPAPIEPQRGTKRRAEDNVGDDHGSRRVFAPEPPSRSSPPAATKLPITIAEVNRFRDIVKAKIPPLPFDPVQTPAEERDNKPVGSSFSTRAVKPRDVDAESWRLCSIHPLPEETVPALLSASNNVLAKLAAAAGDATEGGDHIPGVYKHDDPDYSTETELERSTIYALKPLRTALNGVAALHPHLGTTWEVNNDRFFGKTTKADIAIFPVRNKPGCYTGVLMELKTQQVKEVHAELYADKAFPYVGFSEKPPKTAQAYNGTGWEALGEKRKAVIQIHSILYTKKKRLLLESDSRTAASASLVVADGSDFFVVFSWSTTGSKGTLHHLATSELYHLSDDPKSDNVSLREICFALALFNALEESLPEGINLEEHYGTLPSSPKSPSRKEGEGRGEEGTGGSEDPEAPGGGDLAEPNNQGGRITRGSSGKTGGQTRQMSEWSNEDTSPDKAHSTLKIRVVMPGTLGPIMALRALYLSPETTPPLPSAAVFGHSTTYPSPPDSCGPPSPTTLLELRHQLHKNEAISVYADASYKYAVKIGCEVWDKEEDRSLEFDNEVKIYPEIQGKQGADRCLVRCHGVYVGKHVCLDWFVIITEFGESCKSWQEAKERGVVSILHRFHALGYCHGDVHPRNLVITREGKLRCIDLGRTFKATDKERESELERLLKRLDQGDEAEEDEDW